MYRSHADDGRPSLAVVFDHGAATPTQIGKSLAALAPIQFVIPRSPTARSALPLLESYGTVTMLDRALATGSLPRRADGIITFSERMIPQTALLAQRLGLGYHSPDCAAGLTDKAVQRERLAAAGVDVVRHRSADSRHALQEALRFVGLPAVIKPRHGEGSSHAYPVLRPHDAETIVQHLGENWPRGPFDDKPVIFVVEEFLEDAATGPGIGSYVSVETAVADGRHNHFAITGNCALVPPFRETGHFWPAALEEGLADRITALTGRALHALSVGSGICHTEVKITPTGPRVIEVNGRLGGDRAELARHATGADLVAAAGRIALGQDVALPFQQPHGVHFRYHHQASQGSNTLLEITGAGDVERLPGITGYSHVRLPTPTSTTTTEYLDCLTGIAADHREMTALIRQAGDLLTFSFRREPRGEVVRSRGSELSFALAVPKSAMSTLRLPS